MGSLSTLSLPLPSLRMQALQAGPSNGPLVLLLHGFPESSESWREVLPVLGDAGFRAVAPDLRGYGGTDRPKSGYDIDTLARDIQQLARYLQPDRPAHVVGHDWGGVIAFHLAAWHPETVDRLVAVNAPHMEVMVRNLRNPAQLLRSWYIAYFQVPWLPERHLSKQGGAAVARLIRRALVNPAQVSEERLARLAGNFSRPEAASAALAYYRQAARRLLFQRGSRRTPRIRAPFRLIWGKEDDALGLELTQGLEPWFEHPPQVSYLPGVGHFAPLEAPGQVAALIREHLSVSPGAATPR
ncbi:alpha/beta fold hydrolase [Stigmatella aurantiaca]|uniref:Alpha/beta hydrolase fold n=1 Tax=Stigmatella aurantiaca (strain DW4/3-1) TaxID=378806 RepID=Q08XN2_STIAD|nr:alpha/beta fold hydrolase [Stigmatella aurantiaca]EAU65260.1 alpha/beta hydrolase fold [Stigmatella aurantiaca DW4/3-1]